nr:glycosyltransferase family 2 protein [Xylanimonas cellulosilytica]
MPAAPTPTAPAVHDDVWVVIPLFNEATVIADVVAEVRTAFPHVVCVDDGSTDGSAARAKDAGAVVVHHSVNLGQGASLQTGIEFALRRGARYVVTFDADGQHQLVDAVGMVDMAERENLGIVFGSRFLDARTDPGFLKRLVLRTAVWFTRKSTGLQLTDAHNGLRVLRADAAAGVHLRQDRMAHASEIVLQLGRTRLPWREYPVHVLYTEYSKGKGQSLWNSVNILIDLMVN